MVRRHELSDAEWALVAPLLPPQRGRGRPFKDHRTILNGMLWRLKTGVPWRDLPARYGPWETVYSRFACWPRSGLWARLLAALRHRLDAADQLDWDLWCIGGSNVRAHKAAAGAEKNPSPLAAQRSARSRPRAQPRRRPGQLAGDRGYSVRRLRAWLRRHHIRATIPERKDQIAHRHGRPPAFDRVAYRQRHVIECCRGFLKECRAIATRYEKLAVRYHAILMLGMLRKYLHVYLSNTA
jgi:transposase